MIAFKKQILPISLACFCIILISCGETTTINAHYIYNTGWSKGSYQGFTIAKIRLSKAMSVFNKDFNKYDLSEYQIDSSFCFIPSPRKKTTGNVEKIFFDKENVFGEWFSCSNSSSRKSILGTLENNNWYIILGVGGTIDYYTYIDNTGEAHVYSLGPTNW